MKVLVSFLVISLLCLSCISKKEHNRILDSYKNSIGAVSGELKICKKRLEEQLTIGDVVVKYKLFVMQDLGDHLEVCDTPVAESKVLPYLYALSTATFKAADALDVDTRVVMNTFMYDLRLDYCEIDYWFKQELSKKGKSK